MFISFVLTKETNTTKTFTYANRLRNKPVVLQENSIRSSVPDCSFGRLLLLLYYPYKRKFIFAISPASRAMMSERRQRVFNTLMSGFEIPPLAGLILTD